MYFEVYRAAFGFAPSLVHRISKKEWNSQLLLICHTLLLYSWCDQSHRPFRSTSLTSSRFLYVTPPPLFYAITKKSTVNFPSISDPLQPTSVYSYLEWHWSTMRWWFLTVLCAGLLTVSAGQQLQGGSCPRQGVRDGIAMCQYESHGQVWSISHYF